jgi:ABC-type oligopeptide transport system ATPase subunit
VIISVQDLRREFVVRRAVGRIRRSRTVVTAVDGLSFDIAAGSAWSSGSGHSCGGTCRCASRSGRWPRSTG